MALVKGNSLFVSRMSGLKTLLRLLENRPELLRGAAAADKIIGKAAALLLCHGGVAEIYTPVISEAALPVLMAANISCQWGKAVPYIQNKSGTLGCPMEALVQNVSNPAQAYALLRAAMQPQGISQ